MQLQKIGIRTVKSGVGVMICALLGMCGIIYSTFFAAIACIVSMQVTVKGSLKAGIDRLKGTFIGGLIGFLFTLLIPENPILSCVGIILTIYCCNIANINKSVVIACVVFCSIYLTEDVSNPILYSVSRIIDTSIGIFIGFTVNYFLHRPDYLSRIYEELEIIREVSIEILNEEIKKGVHNDTRETIYDKCDNLEERVRDRICYLRRENVKLKELYKNFLDELEYSFSRNDEDLKQIIDICNQIYFHFKILDEIYDRCYLNMENYIRAKEIVYDLNYEIDKCENSLSIVYNYHIKAVIDDIDQLYKIIN